MIGLVKDLYQCSRSPALFYRSTWMKSLEILAHGSTCLFFRFDVNSDRTFFLDDTKNSSQVERTFHSDFMSQLQKPHTSFVSWWQQQKMVKIWGRVGMNRGWFVRHWKKMRGQEGRCSTEKKPLASLKKNISLEFDSERKKKRKKNELDKRS